jgi:hypothetical protein
MSPEVIAADARSHLESRLYDLRRELTATVEFACGASLSDLDDAQGAMFALRAWKARVQADDDAEAMASLAAAVGTMLDRQKLEEETVRWADFAITYLAPTKRTAANEALGRFLEYLARTYRINGLPAERVNALADILQRRAARRLALKRRAT